MGGKETEKHFSEKDSVQIAATLHQQAEQEYLTELYILGSDTYYQVTFPPEEIGYQRFYDAIRASIPFHEMSNLARNYGLQRGGKDGRNRTDDLVEFDPMRHEQHEDSTQLSLHEGEDGLVFLSEVGHKGKTIAKAVVQGPSTYPNDVWQSEYERTIPQQPNIIEELYLRAQAEAQSES